MRHVHESFGDIPSFLDNEKLPPSKKKLQEILSNPAKHRKLKIELAITIDAMKAFVEATYCLEGGGPLIFNAFEEICMLETTAAPIHCPNTNAVARTLANYSTQLQQLTDYAKSCVKPAFDYFTDKFTKNKQFLYLNSLL